MSLPDASELWLWLPSWGAAFLRYTQDKPAPLPVGAYCGVNVMSSKEIENPELAAFLPATVNLNA